MADNVYVYLVDLPDRVDEMVTPCFDGFTVYISSKLSYAGRVRAYHHALRHIERHDFEKFDVQEIETKNHPAEP